MSLKNTFDAIDLVQVRDWVSSRRQEDLHLDFKQLRESPKLTKDDRRNLAKSISAFGNSDGGIIAWGVDARPDESGVDAASALLPVRGGQAVLSKFYELTGQATTPIVDGVEHRLLPLEKDEAIILTYVPVSNAGPHMAGLGEGRYYKRSGSASYQMEHFDIADMFGRRRRPELRLALRPGVSGRTSGSQGRSVELQIVLSLHNSGRGLARFPLLKLKMSGDYLVSPHELDGNGRPGLPIVTRPPQVSGWRVYAGGTDHVIHPEMTTDVTLVTRQVPESLSSLPNLRVGYCAVAEGVRPYEDEALIAGSELLKLAQDTFKTQW